MSIKFFFNRSFFTVLVTLGTIGLIQSCGSSPEISSQDSQAVPLETEVTPSPSPTPVDPLAEFDEETSQRLTATANLLAGIELEAGSPLANLQTESAWVNHSNALNNAWSKLEEQQLSKVRDWSGTELKAVNTSSEPIFYPFSGPDFLYVHSMFPKGSDYILIGLEPVGILPELDNLSASQRDLQFQQLRSSLQDVLNFSFFITKEMTAELSQQGVIPILLTFMARTNNEVLEVEYIGLDENAEIQVLENGLGKQGEKQLIPGVKISFVAKGESQPQTLYYFQTDLSNYGMNETPEFSQFVQSFENPLTYLKATSYTLHEAKYKTIRNLILSESRLVLQDDSAIPIKYFTNDKWDVEVYGNYTRPIPVFSQFYQADLKEVYQKQETVKPLNFGIGYNYQVNNSNLILAEVKE